MELKDFPFSRYGSMLAVSVGQRSDSLVIHDCRCSDRRSRVLSVKIGHSGHAVSSFVNKGSHIEIGNGLGRIWMIDDENLGLDIQGSQVLIEPILNTPRVHVDEYAYWLNTDSSESPLYVHVRTMEGEAQRVGPIRPSSRDRIQVVIQLNYSDGRVSFPRPNFERQAWLTEMERKAFTDRLLSQENPKGSAAAYTIWSNFVRKQVAGKVDAPLASKVDGCFFNAVDSLLVCGALGYFDLDRPESPLRNLLLENREDVLLSQRWGGAKGGFEGEASLPLFSLFLESLVAERHLVAQEREVIFRFLWNVTDAWIAKCGISGFVPEASFPDASEGLGAADGSVQTVPQISPVVLGLLLSQCELMLKLGEQIELTFHLEVLLRLRERLLILFGSQWRETISPNLEQLPAGSTVVPCSESLLMALVARRFFEVEDSRITEVFRRVLLPFGIEADCPRSRTLGEGSGSAVVPSFNFLLAWMLRQGGFQEEANELKHRLKTLIVDQEGGFFGSYSGSSGKGVGQPGNTATAAISLLLKDEGGFHR